MFDGDIFQEYRFHYYIGIIGVICNNCCAISNSYCGSIRNLYRHLFNRGYATTLM